MFTTTRPGQKRGSRFRPPNPPCTAHAQSQHMIGFAGGLNLYAYSSNNPVRFVDPSGLDPSWSNMAQGRVLTAQLLNTLGKSKLFNSRFKGDISSVLGQNGVYYGTPPRQGMTGFAGNAGKIYINSAGSESEKALTLFHEGLHKVLERKNKCGPNLKRSKKSSPNPLAKYGVDLEKDLVEHAWIYLQESRVMAELAGTGAIDTFGSSFMTPFANLNAFDMQANPNGKLDSDWDYLLGLAGYLQEQGRSMLGD
jgi:hypothetical protein